MFCFYRKNESNRKRNIAAEVLGGAVAPHQQFAGGMAANQTSFDGSQIRNQVAYAFKNRSIVTAMPQQFQHQNSMGACMGMPQMMYGGMGCMQGMGNMGMQGMGNMGMQGMNWGATNYCMDDGEEHVKKPKKKKKKINKTVDIDLSQENNGNSSASVSDEE